MKFTVTVCNSTRLVYQWCSVTFLSFPSTCPCNWSLPRTNTNYIKFFFFFLFIIRRIFSSFYSSTYVQGSFILLTFWCLFNIRWLFYSNICNRIVAYHRIRVLLKNFKRAYVVLKKYINERSNRRLYFRAILICTLVIYIFFSNQLDTTFRYLANSSLHKP